MSTLAVHLSCVATLAATLACSSSNFSGTARTKTPAPESGKPDPTALASPGPKPPPVDCTKKSAADCEALIDAPPQAGQDPGTASAAPSAGQKPESFRVVVCAKKGTAACDTMTSAEKKLDDKIGSKILVVECSDAGSKDCKTKIDAGITHLDDKTNPLLSNGTDTADKNAGPGSNSGSTGKDELGSDNGTASGADPAIDDGTKTVASLATSSTGIVFDGKARICLDWKAGQLIVTKLYEKYFLFRGSYDVTSPSGKVEHVDINGAGSFPLPGDWSKVCDATASNAGFNAITSGHRTNQPIISTSKSGTQACFDVDDAEGDRGGSVIMTGVDFKITKC